jgi:threonine aldolase
MRRLMAASAVGDDVYGEDPTVNELQENAARLVGKEEALFVSSGTMGNLLGVLVNADAGSEVIVDSESHMFLYEVGAPGALAGVQLRPVVTERGIISAEQVVAALRPTDEIDQPLSSMVSLEDTHNRHGWGVLASAIDPFGNSCGARQRAQGSS